MNYKKIELKVRRIVEKQLEKGRYLWSGGITGSWLGMIGDDGLCCLVGVIAVDAGAAASDGTLRHQAATHLGINDYAMGCIEHGFEAGRYGVSLDNELRNIGDRIRRDYFSL